MNLSVLSDASVTDHKSAALVGHEEDAPSEPPRSDFCVVSLILFFYLQASEMLLFNKKLTAAQACELGLVTEVFPDSSFQSEVWTRLKAYAKLPRNVITHGVHSLEQRVLPGSSCQLRI